MGLKANAAGSTARSEEPPAGAPKRCGRDKSGLVGSRQARGQRTRRAILEAAILLGGGPEPVSVAAIAEAAGAYPNQVTYYFASKNALLLEAAFVALLRDARRMEAQANKARSPQEFRTTLSRLGLSLPAARRVVTALALCSADSSHAERVRQMLDLTFAGSERYLASVLTKRGWVLQVPLRTEVRNYWSMVLGAGLITSSGYPGSANDISLASILTTHEQ